MTIVAVGIDLAKTLFAVHGVDEHGKPALVRPAIKRTTLLELIAKLLPCQELQPHSDVSTTMSTRMRSRWRPAGRQGRYIR